MMVEWLFLAVPCGCLRLVAVVFPDHTHLLFLVSNVSKDIALSLAGQICKLSNLNIQKFQ